MKKLHDKGIIDTYKMYQLEYYKNDWSGRMMSNYNGYILIPKGHKWENKIFYEMDYEQKGYIELNIHGGCTFEQTKDGNHWIGFDTSHYGDTAITKSLDFVKKECRRIVDELGTHPKKLKINKILMVCLRTILGD